MDKDKTGTDGLLEYTTMQDSIVCMQESIICGLFTELLQYRAIGERDTMLMQKLQEVELLKDEGTSTIVIKWQESEIEKMKGIISRLWAVVCKLQKLQLSADNTMNTVTMEQIESELDKLEYICRPFAD